MVEVPDVLRDRLRRFGQEHVLRWWPELADAERTELIAQLQWLDLLAFRTGRKIIAAGCVAKRKSRQLSDCFKSQRSDGEKARGSAPGPRWGL